MICLFNESLTLNPQETVVMKTYPNDKLTLAPGSMVSLTMKLQKHLQARDPNRVKDYLMTVGTIQPDLEQVNFVDPTLLDQCVELLRQNGWEVKLDTRVGDGLVMIPPESTGWVYRSHRAFARKEECLEGYHFLESVSSTGA